MLEVDNYLAHLDKHGSLELTAASWLVTKRYADNRIRNFVTRLLSKLTKKSKFYLYTPHDVFTLKPIGNSREDVKRWMYRQGYRIIPRKHFCISDSWFVVTTEFKRDITRDMPDDLLVIKLKRPIV